jgi:hypothetical protein
VGNNIGVDIIGEMEADSELRGRVAATQWTPEYRPASAHGAA